MTSEDLELDPAIFLSNHPLTLYRLARARYANLSGIGAAAAPGRWNRPGQEAIHTSTEVGVPVLERLVHTPKELIPSNLALMKIMVRGNCPVWNVVLYPQARGFWEHVFVEGVEPFEFDSRLFPESAIQESR